MTETTPTTRTASATLNIANLLTLSRLALLPVVIIGIVTHMGWLAVTAMTLAQATDLVDGRIARRMKIASPAGGMLDSTVDFVFIYALFIALYAAGRLGIVPFVIIYSAMLPILALQGRALLTGAGQLPRTRFGKPMGAVQYTYLLFLVVHEVLPAYPWLSSADFAIFIVLAGLIIGNTLECFVVLLHKPIPERSPAGDSAKGNTRSED